jgi:hypothetical protein
MKEIRVVDGARSQVRKPDDTKKAMKLQSLAGLLIYCLRKIVHMTHVPTLKVHKIEIFLALILKFVLFLC